MPHILGGIEKHYVGKLKCNLLESLEIPAKKGTGISELSESHANPNESEFQ